MSGRCRSRRLHDGRTARSHGVTVFVAALAAATSPLVALLVPGAASALAPHADAPAPPDCVEPTDPHGESPESQPLESIPTDTDATSSTAAEPPASDGAPTGDTSNRPTEPTDAEHRVDDRPASEQPGSTADHDPMPATGSAVRAVVRVAAVLFALGGIAAFIAAGSPRPTPRRPGPEQT